MGFIFLAPTIWADPVTALSSRIQQEFFCVSEGAAPNFQAAPTFLPVGSHLPQKKHHYPRPSDCENIKLQERIWKTRFYMEREREKERENKAPDTKIKTSS